MRVRDLGNATSLELVILIHNQLEGGIPEELGKLSKLRYLLLGQNRLSGEIPQAIYNLSLLYELALELNMLVGELPTNIGDTSYTGYQHVGRSHTILNRQRLRYVADGFVR
jgi:Leucine-rich repeat (LRR) protein